jgi:YHS domain-containing protein
VKLVRDPVCGTFVAPGTALSLSAGGTTHYFCSDECRSKYRAA